MTNQRTPASCQRRNRPDAARGFSLIEVMISASLLLVGLAGSLAAISTYQKNVAHQRHLTQGIHIAETAMEQMLLVYPSDPLLTDGDHGPQSYDEVGHHVASGGKYNAYWSVESGIPIPGMRKLSVRVEWMEGADGRNVEFFTYRR